MSGQLEQAHAVVAGLALRGEMSAWRLERPVVARRLHELIDDPDLIRQGNLNLCGPAALFVIWLRADPVAVARYAVGLFEDGRADIGGLRVHPSARLRGLRYGATRRGSSCPQADWMLMAGLRDSTNWVLRYARQDGLAEAAAAITLPGAMRTWLRATHAFTSVVDQISLVRPTRLAHALASAPSTDREVLLLVAQEMFRLPSSRLGRARDRVVGLVPNHWIILRSPVRRLRDDRVGFRFWSWGAEHPVVLDRARFERHYFGCLRATLPAGGFPVK